MLMVYNNEQFEVLSVSGREPLPTYSLEKIKVGIKSVNTRLIMENRAIQVRILIEGDNRLEVGSKLDRLSKCFYTDVKRQKLVFDDIDRYWLATVEKITTLVEYEHFSELEIVFNTYPISKDVTKKTIKSTRVTNDGTYTTYGKIKFKLQDAIKRFTLAIEGSIANVTLSDTYGLEGEWVIDMESRTVYKNNEIYMGAVDFANTNWFNFCLEVGETNFITSTYPIDFEISFERSWLR